MYLVIAEEAVECSVLAEAVGNSKGSRRFVLKKHYIKCDTREDAEAHKKRLEAKYDDVDVRIHDMGE